MTGPYADDSRNPWIVSPPQTGAEPALTRSDETVRHRVMRALADVLGYQNWEGNPISTMESELGSLADAAIHALLTAPPDDDRAYNGEYLPPRRQLTARERDILTRVLHSIVRPWTKLGRTDKSSEEARKQISRWVSLGEATDLKTLAEIATIVNPRSEGER